MRESDQDYFFDEPAARAKLEAVLWPNGPLCGRCGRGDRVYDLGHIRRGLKKCAHCRKQFTIRTGTALEWSHMPMYKWLRGIYLVASTRDETIRRVRLSLWVSGKFASYFARQVEKVIEAADLRRTGDDIDEGALNALVKNLAAVRPPKSVRPPKRAEKKKKRTRPVRRHPRKKKGGA